MDLGSICLLFAYFFNFALSCQGTVIQSPLTACVGETVTVSCVLTPPDGQSFQASIPSFIVGIVAPSLSAVDINNNVSHGGIDLSRLAPTVNNSGISTRISGTLTLSYLPNDEGLLLGCSAPYFDSATMTNNLTVETIQLNQTAPPSAPSLQSSVSKFDTATCSADISLSWNTPPSNSIVDRYFLYLDGSPLVTTNSNSYIHSTILNINTDYQYSVTAMSCAGNSTNSSANVYSVKSYSLMRSSQYLCLAFDNVTGLTVNWGLSTPIQPPGVSGLDISYSLQLLYSHSRQCVTYRYTDSTSFTLPSSQLSYNTVLTAHNFSQLDGVETYITANLMIVQQCGQSFNGTAMECFLRSSNPTILPTSSISISTSIPNNASTPTSTSPGISSSSTSIQMITTAVPSKTVSINSSSTFLLTSIIFALLFIMSLCINFILIIAVILLTRKIQQSRSSSKSKPAPAHPYQYIDLDKVICNTSSPTQQQSPHDYVPMSSVPKKDTTKPFYANLK